MTINKGLKKGVAVASILALAAAALAGCSPSSSSPFDSGKNINVVSREDGSGTRSAFIELLGILEKGPGGTSIDKTTKEAAIASKTDVMLTNISSDPYAIGYVSLGSVNSSVKTLKLDSAAATSQNIKDKKYKLSRPFNIAVKGEASGLTKDFIDFILSKEGQQVVSRMSLIKINDNAGAFAGAKPSGKIVVAGSSSVTPVIEKLREAYLKINTAAEIEIQQNDSTSGMNAVMDGIANIGMASRDLKDSEKAVLNHLEIALDGIAIIVNTQNTLTDITSDNAKNIFTGSLTKWSDVIK